jgi:outer membrane protein OmpA-like peptidoglycan-associated protein
MRKNLFLIPAALFLLFSSSALAQSDEMLVFPQTEAEIVDVLKGQSGRPIYVIGGKTIYMIEVKRPEEDKDLENAPKAGALVHFDFGSAKIRPESHSLLDEFGKALQGGLAEARFVIAGHTDNYGSEVFNKGLSKERAQAVKSYLVDRHGVDPERLEIRAYGESMPIAPNDTPENRQLNRRVEFIRLEKKASEKTS